MRPGGPTTVGFAVRRPTERWTGTVGQEFALVLFARSVGGAGRGISLRIFGDGVKRAEFTRVEYAGEAVEFTKEDDGTYSLELTECELPEGVQYPLDPKPKNDKQKEAAAEMLEVTQFELIVYGIAKDAGSDLLSLSISATESNSAPLKWTRPLVIT
jgi:hypothetical protein